MKFWYGKEGIYMTKEENLEKLNAILEGWKKRLMESSSDRFSEIALKELAALKIKGIRYYYGQNFSAISFDYETEFETYKQANMKLKELTVYDFFMKDSNNMIFDKKIYSTTKRKQYVERDFILIENEREEYNNLFDLLEKELGHDYFSEEFVQPFIDFVEKGVLKGDQQAIIMKEKWEKLCVKAKKSEEKFNRMVKNLSKEEIEREIYQEYPFK